jgi:hypothetical protein
VCICAGEMKYFEQDHISILTCAFGVGCDDLFLRLNAAQNRKK